MSDHDTTAAEENSAELEPDQISADGVVAFTLPEGTRVTAPRVLAETIGWQPAVTARRSRRK